MAVVQAAIGWINSDCVQIEIELRSGPLIIPEMIVYKPRLRGDFQFRHVSTG